LRSYHQQNNAQQASREFIAPDKTLRLPLIHHKTQRCSGNNQQALQNAQCHCSKLGCRYRILLHIQSTTNTYTTTDKQVEQQLQMPTALTPAVNSKRCCKARQTCCCCWPASLLLLLLPNVLPAAA
jgi:hypothetical protein